MKTTEATKSLLDEIKPLENRCGEIRAKHARILSIPQIDAIMQAVNEYEALNEVAESARPFNASPFAMEMGGNVTGDNSPIYARNGATLTLGDFRKIQAALAKLTALRS